MREKLKAAACTVGIAAAIIPWAGMAHAQTANGWTRVLQENFANPDTVTVTVPTAASVTIRWGSGSTFVTRTFAPGTTTFLAANTTFGDPTPGVVKELDVQGTDLSDFTVDGKPLTPPSPTLVQLLVSPMQITATTGTVVQTKATCTWSNGSATDCTAQATFTCVKGGVAVYTVAGALLGTQAGPAEVDVSLGSITVKLNVLIVDLPIYFNGGTIAAN